jgi:hypothetical protein
MPSRLEVKLISEMAGQFGPKYSKLQIHKESGLDKNVEKGIESEPFAKRVECKS